MTKIALAQTTTGDDFGANLEAADRMVREAAENGAALLAFPEVFLYLGGYKGKLKVAEPLDGAIVSRFREAAARHGMMLLLGSIHERIPDDASRVYNTSVLIGANGEVLASYRKLKLFDVALPAMKIKESDSIAPGDAVPPVVDTPIGKLGLTICFDLRFSDLYLDLRRRGAEIVFIPSNFTAPTGAAHWEVLIRARAVEGQYFVVAPAQTGKHNAKYRSYGHSMLVDPWGKVVAMAPADPGVIYGDINLAYLEQVRAELPMGM
jgi:deaminated glutathione amidase